MLNFSIRSERNFENETRGRCQLRKKRGKIITITQKGIFSQINHSPGLKDFFLITVGAIYALKSITHGKPCVILFHAWICRVVAS